MLKQNKVKISLSLALTGLVSVGCYDYVGETVYLDQGWDDTNEYREVSYNMTQGSRLIPYGLFMNLEVEAEGLKLNSDTVMNALRYLPSKEVSAHNPDKLAVGFVKDIDKNNKEWVGITCAACHTGQINYNGIGIRVDGAPAMADFIGLLKTTQKSLASTAQDPEKLERLAKNMYAEQWQENLSELEGDLVQYDKKVQGIIQRSAGSTNQGHGRVDAFGAIGNEIFVDDLKNENNFKEANAPVSYPVLWDTPALENVQWTGNVQNPLGRNYGEVLGTFGEIDLTNPEAFLENSVNVENIFQLEEMLRVLKSPVWPTEYLGELEQEKIEEGRALYTKADISGYSCVECHSLKDENGQYPLTPAEENLFGMQFIQTVLTPVSEIGTDSSAADAIYQPFIVDVGPILGSILGAQYLPRTDAQTIVVGLGLQKAFADLELTSTEQAAYMGYRIYAEGYEEPTDTYAYKARPLNGVWASSPYLHNGSVRTLRDLLNHENNREKSFLTGTRSFDPKNVGFESFSVQGAQVLDTALDGNHNSGHNYGVYYTSQEKEALVEFMKSL